MPGGRMRGIAAVGAVLGVLTVGASSASAVTVVIEGTAGDDSIYIEGLAPTSGTYEVNDQHTPTPFAGATTIVVDAAGGNDRISISNQATALLAPPLGIRVHGGDGADKVFEWGGQSVVGSVDHVPADGPGTVTSTHHGSQEQKVVLHGVEELEDTIWETQWTYRGTTGTDNVGFVDGEYIPTRTGAVCCYPGSLTNTGEKITPTSKDTIIVDTKTSGPTPDVVTLTGVQPIADELIVDDGSTAPEDTVHVDYHPGFRGPTLGMPSHVKVRAGTVDGVGSYSGTTLALEAGRIVTDTGTLQTSVDKLEVQSGSPIAVRNDRKLQIGGAWEKLSGVKSSGGDVSVEAPGKLTVALGDEAKGGNVTLTSDGLDVLGRVAATGGVVRLRPRSAGIPLGVGTANDPAGAYSVSDVEIDKVDASRVELGSPASGLLTASGPFTADAPLTLISGGGFTGSGGRALEAPSLAFVDGSGTGRAWTIDAATVTVGGGTPIPFAVTQSASFAGSSGPDTFRVKASPLVPFTIDGADPSALPGDTLFYSAEGRTTSGDSSPPDGSITSPQRRPVDFRAIESVSILP
jgi:hypothetical protein